ncbi:hypothetical protein AAFF_G00035910 [Aldrovandia affinis]|uniref:Uncharacterized protein n=1 Tax=Aldrovandia affinis TaxID=143900 RepID=A0AAD7S3B8_9TELE|nr:hypothetical protein AAFF_G00035910 [Aldrovandia affinis]
MGKVVPPSRDEGREKVGPKERLPGVRRDAHFSTDLQYPLTIFPATTLDILSHCLADPSTGAPNRMASSTTPSLPGRGDLSIFTNRK